MKYVECIEMLTILTNGTLDLAINFVMLIPVPVFFLFVGEEF